MRLEQAIGLVLRQLRDELGLTQEELGFQCGYHTTYISQLERGLKNPSVRAIFHLTQPLRTTPSTFIEMVERKLKLSKRRP